MTDKQIRAWFQRARGITAATLDAYGVEVANGEILYPYEGATKHRKGLEKGERAFWWEPKLGPGQIPPYLPPDFAPTREIFLVEGETDTMRLWQELPEGRREGVMGLPGVSTWSDLFMDYVPEKATVYVILDSDAEYQARQATELAWSRIRHDLGKRARRVKLPNGPKDVCEFFERYDLSTFEELLEAESSRYHYEALDWEHPPEPPAWLVEPLFPYGDLVLLIGAGGARKSFLALDLAVKCLAGEDEWLQFKLPGRPLRVLYLDEENPAGEVFRRLSKLGFDSDEHGHNLRYVWQRGVRLDKRPDRILDDAVAFGPDLIIFDAMIRFHTQEEASSGAIAQLFNGALKPLARETGAAVLLIHHVTKEVTDNSYRRARGSSDITNAVDVALDVQLTADKDIRNVSVYKNRHAPETDFLVRFRDMGNPHDWDAQILVESLASFNETRGGTPF